MNPLTVQPLGLHLKLAKRVLEVGLKPRCSGVHFHRPGDQIQRLLGRGFTSFRSSPTAVSGLIKLGVNPLRQNDMLLFGRRDLRD